MIGKEITTLLKANSDLTDMVPGENIFPYIIDTNTPLPALIYNIDTVAPVYDKDGYSNEVVTFSIGVITNDYKQHQNIIKEVRACLEPFNGNHPTTGAITNKITLVGYSEAFVLSEEAFITRLNYSTQINILNSIT